MEKETLKQALESLLFITDRPLKLGELSELLGRPQEEVGGLVRELQSEAEARGAVRVHQVAEGFQMATRPEHGEFVRRLFKERTTFRLSVASLETLAIISYRQPLTRAEIEEIRGVEVIAALETLLERRLIKVVGRKETIGRPLLYGTTMEFLRQFGLESLGELPPIESLAPEGGAVPAGVPVPEVLPVGAEGEPSSGPGAGVAPPEDPS